MADGNWLKMYRDTLKNSVVMKSSAHFALWHLMLYMAVYEPRQEEFGGKIIMLNPGQFVCTEKELSQKLKLNPSKTHRITNDFISAKQIEKQTSSKNSLISILNWSKYQGSEKRNETPAKNKRKTNEKPPYYINKELKKEEALACNSSPPAVMTEEEYFKLSPEERMRIMKEN